MNEPTDGQKVPAELLTPEHIAGLIRTGLLIPVQVFGSNDDRPAGEDGHPWGYGLCDRFSRHSSAGSDCNRGAFFLLRPSDAATDNPVIREALNEVLDDPEENLWD